MADISKIKALDGTTYDIKDTQARSSMVTDVQMNGTSIVNNHVANIPIPAVTSSDNGAILQVVDGQWTAVAISIAAGVNF